jgi:pimeloyl-ACP methyl ester carboxylesterase
MNGARRNSGRAGGNGEDSVKATGEWQTATGVEFSAGPGRHGYAHLRHYTAQFCEWGDGPPLVLIPGLAGGYELLGPLARLLAGHFRVISYQLRGEDDCFALRQRFDLDDLVADLAEFLDHQRLERPVVMGVSFGGVLALQFAARRPSRLDRLIVQGAGPRFERSLLQQVAGLILSRYPLPTDSPFVNQFFNLLFGGRQEGPVFEFVTRQCWQTDQGVMAHRFRLVERFDLTAELHRVRVPALLLAGDRDLLVSERGLASLSEGIGECRRVNLPGCGHLAFVTQAAAVAGEVRRFLQER